MTTTNENLITINGAQGEGGGQILRTSLSLAACLGKSIKILRIRAGRKKPGLMRQHLTCVLAAQKLCDAEVEGAEIGSSELIFKPNAINIPSELNFDIGTAGSTSLVFQTVLPIILFSGQACEIKFVGGTHNMAAPTYDFIENSFLNTLNRFGTNITCELQQPGFYPVGGGRWSVKVGTQPLKEIDLSERGELVSRKAVARLGNLPTEIAKRELNMFKKRLQWKENELEINEAKCLGNGNALIANLSFENITTVFDQIGVRNRSAEKVALSAISDIKHYLKTGAAVEEYLADQLLLPMALAQGGKFTMVKPSMHFQTNCEVIEQLSNAKLIYEETEGKAWKVEVFPHRE